MIITYDRIVEDLTTDKYHLFVHNFPNVEPLLNAIRVNPEDILIINRGMTALKKQVNLTRNLKKIYGDDSEFVLEYPKSAKISEIAEVFRIKDADYDEWFKGFTLERGKRRIKLFNTCYNSNKDEYVVSIVYLGR